MVREIVLRSWCDFHMGEHDQPVPGTSSHAVTLDGRSFTVDLCDECAERFYNPLAERVANHSAREGSDPKPPPSSVRPPHTQTKPADYRPRNCFVCDKRFESRGVFDYHMEHEHHAKTAEVFGLECPLCPAKFGRAQGLGVHATRKHTDVAHNIADLFDAAKEAGDPRGVIARQLAALPNREQLFEN